MPRPPAPVVPSSHDAPVSERGRFGPRPRRAPRWAWRLALAAVATALLGAAPAVAAFTAAVVRSGNGAAAAAVFRPVVREAPSIRGDVVAGRTLEVDDGAWDRQPEGFDRTWLRCDDACEEVGTGATYTLGAADAGHRMRVRVRASNAGGAAVAESAPTEVVAATTTDALAAESAPAISGRAVVGELLTLTPGNWSGDPDVTHRWQRCTDDGCVDAGDAATYRVGADDAGFRLRVVEHATRGDTTASATSAPVGPVRTRYADTILASDPVAYWPFDEPAGPSFTDVRGGLVAALSGVAEAGVPGSDRTGLTLASGALFAPSTVATTPTDAFTIEAWVRPVSTADGSLAGKFNEAFSRGYMLDIEDGRFRFRTARNGSRSTAHGALVEPGRWQYVVATHSGTAIRVWTDGVEGASVAAPRPESSRTAASRLASVKGTVDEIALYPRALTRAEITARWELLRPQAP